MHQKVQSSVLPVQKVQPLKQIPGVQTTVQTAQPLKQIPGVYTTVQAAQPLKQIPDVHSTVQSTGILNRKERRRFSHPADRRKRCIIMRI